MSKIIFESQKGRLHFNMSTPAINVSTTIIYFNKLMIEKLKLHHEQRALFSKDADTGQWYFCVLPELSIRSGYKLQVSGSKHGGLCMNGARRYSDNGLIKGPYILSDPEFDGELDWFELIKAEINGI